MYFIARLKSQCQKNKQTEHHYNSHMLEVFGPLFSMYGINMRFWI